MGAGVAREQEKAGIGTFLVTEHQVARIAASYRFGIFFRANFNVSSIPNKSSPCVGKGKNPCAFC
jgi:hypothetical protein